MGAYNSCNDGEWRLISSCAVLAESPRWRVKTSSTQARQIHLSSREMFSAGSADKSSSAAFRLTGAFFLTGFGLAGFAGALVRLGADVFAAFRVGLGRLAGMWHPTRKHTKRVTASGPGAHGNRTTIRRVFQIGSWRRLLSQPASC